MPGPIDGLKKASPRPVGPSNMVEQELADLFNEAIHTNEDYPWDKIRSAQTGWLELPGSGPSQMPVPPPPPGFRQNTLTPPTGGAFEGEEAPWDYLQRIVPNLRGRSPSIQYGPSAGTTSELLKAGFGPQDYGIVNKLGSTNLATKKIDLNPSISGGPRQGGFRDMDGPTIRGYNDSTVAHELGHAVGIDHGRGMNNVEGLMRMAREYDRGPVAGLESMQSEQSLADIIREALADLAAKPTNPKR